VREFGVDESVYKVIELVGTSTESWERAADAAVERASKNLRDLRIAEVIQLDFALEHPEPGGRALRVYRARLEVSFKYDGEEL
jgi:flavin-binding protein dodecin